MSKTGTRESKRTSSQIWSWMRNIGIFALLYLIVQAILQSEIESFWNSSVKPALSLEVKFALSVWQIGLALLVTVAVCSIGLYVTVTRFKLGRIQNELPKRQSFDLLTEQERQILQLRVGGYSPQEIAQRLNITKINQVLKSVYGKINAKDEVQAILWYYQLSVSEDSNSLDQPNSETFAWTDRADPSTHVFIVSYIVGYLALMVFLYLPRTFLSLEKVQGFWDDYAGMYFVLPLAAGLYNLYRFWNSESSPFQKESLTSLDFVHFLNISRVIKEGTKAT